MDAEIELLAKDATAGSTHYVADRYLRVVYANDGSTLLVHHAVRIDDQPEERERMRDRVRALDADPEQVRHEYRQRVPEPRVAIPGFRVAQFL